jgi:catechol 2,3-dioxygenase-like lactoylglutathione lyase family enzyme
MRGTRRRRFAAALLAAWTLAVAVDAHTGSAGELHVQAVESIGITVDDLDRSVAFFTQVLGFEKVSEVEQAGAPWEKLTGVFGARFKVARLRLGQEAIELTDYLAPRGRPYPQDTRANDVWFQHIAIVVSDMDAAYARLRAAGVEHASTGPQSLPQSIPAAAGIRAFYFRDPDGHFLELLEFPPGKGDARWHVASAAGGPLFLGIDHTAIVVTDTDRALAFYRDRLGLVVAGSSENSGTEQEHLNNVEHARLRITTLRPPQGPGVELLEYLAPRDGRAAPAPIRSNDLAYWQTRLTVDRIPEGATFGRIGKPVVVSPAGLGFDSATVLHDSDGHAIELAANP